MTKLLFEKREHIMDTRKMGNLFVIDDLNALSMVVPGYGLMYLTPNGQVMGDLAVMWNHIPPSIVKWLKVNDFITPLTTVRLQGCDYTLVKLNRAKMRI